MDEKLRSKRFSIESANTLFLWLLLFAATALLTLSTTYQPLTTISLVLLAVYFIKKGSTGQLVDFRTGIEPPLILFILSAGISVLLSYNQGPAMLQFVRMLLAAAFFFAIRDSQPPEEEIIAKGFVLAASILAIYWTASNRLFPGSNVGGWVSALGEYFRAGMPDPPGPEYLNNIVAGTLLVSVPFSFSLVWMSWKARKPGSLIFTATAVFLILIGILFTGSRRAWISLSIILFIYLMFRFQIKFPSSRRLRSGFWIGAVLLGSAFFLVFFKNPWVDAGISEPVFGSLRSKIDIWQDGLRLLQDYLFTGSGLQTFSMVHAAYAILIHVPFSINSLNTFLQVWIEQGIVGAFAFAWGLFVIIKWAWQGLYRTDIPVLGWAGLAALFSAALIGFTDVIFYNDPTLPFAGVLLGYAALTIPHRPQFDKRYNIPSGVLNLRWSNPWIWSLVVVLIVLGASGLVYRRSLLAAWHANLGAIEQTRQELGRYDPNHFDNPTLDQIRQITDQSLVEEHFRKALMMDENNRTALQRLSMIYIGRGETSNALSVMEAAWAKGYRDPATRMLYSDALVADGQVEKAVDVVRNVSWAESRLLGQAWYRYWLAEDYQKAAYAWQAVVALDPENTDAAIWLSNAQEHLKP